MTVIVEERMPAATGAKIMGIEQFELAASVPTHVDVPSEKSFTLTPPNAILVTCIAAFPVLVRTRFWGPDVIPTVTVPGMLNVPAGVNDAISRKVIPRRKLKKLFPQTGNGRVIMPNFPGRDGTSGYFLESRGNPERR